MRNLLIFVLGVLAGALGMAYVRPVVAPAPAAEPPAEARRLPATRPARRGDGTVTVILESGSVLRRLPGVVMNQPAALIVRFDDYVRSERAYWISATGLRHVIDEVLAIDLDIGLIAFAVDDAEVDGLALGPERGSLFLGLDVGLIGQERAGAAEVYSAGVEHGPNHFRYRLRAADAPPASLLAVVSLGSGELIGLADRPWNAHSLSAVDVGTLRDFLDNRLRPSVRTMERINMAIFGQPAGLAREFDDLVREGRWAAAMARAKSLLERSPERLHRNRRAAVYQTMIQQARALIATNQTSAAQYALLGHVRRFGANQNVLRELVDIEIKQNSIESALTLLDQLALESADIKAEDLRQVTRTTVARFLSGTERSDTSAIALLLTVLERDPDYAPYHRQLGGLLFAASRYQEAEFYLNRAVELDPSYAADVARELDTARQRRQVDRQVVEVPLLGSGSGLYVNVQLNGSSQTFRFLLDTGASYSAINTSTMLRLGLNNIFANGAPLIELETANGRVFAQTFRLQSMNLAGAVVEQVPVVVLEDMGPLDGLVGLSFLRHFDVQINQQDGLLLLSPR